MTTKPANWRWELLPLGIALLSLTVSAYTGYTSNDRETVQRVAVVESHQGDDRRTLEEIKLAVKELDAKVTQILIILGTKH